MLAESNRNEEAMTVWEEIERRFANSDEPMILQQVASALVNRARRSPG